MTNPCPACDSEHTRLVTAQREVQADDGATLPYVDELTECDECGERFYTHDQSLASSRARAAALRAHAHLLTPDEIRGIRERFDLSQAAVEDLFALGAKTLVRWERGTVCQSRAADLLLRVLGCFGPAAFDCARGVAPDAIPLVLFPEPSERAFVAASATLWTPSPRPVAHFSWGYVTQVESTGLVGPGSFASPHTRELVA